MGRKEVELNIFRYHPESGAAPYYNKLRVEIDPDMLITILDLLIRVQHQYLSDLALDYGCRAGQCGSCPLKINGVNQLACKTMVDGDVITIEPRDNYEIIRDLVVDTESDLRRLLEGRAGFKTRFKPPHRVTPEEYQKVSEIRQCIECFACVSACQVMKAASKAKGPLVMRSIAQFAFDPRISDFKSRLSQALKAGAYYCTTCKRCTESCDKEIDIRDWVRQLRRAIYYDKSLYNRQPKAIAQAIEGGSASNGRYQANKKPPQY